MLRDGSDEKAWGEAWEDDLSSDARVDIDDHRRAVRKSCTPPSCRTNLVRVGLTLKNYDAACGSRPTSHLPHSKRRQPQVSSDPWIVVHHTAEGRLRAGRDGWQQLAWWPWPRQAHGCADVTYP
ncbi:hypothetical protein EI94DRAFT_865658 [Lactarius quietus]|nr:hypothetical protein EI94DRAFT_865658 [Lactarius quietus]